MIITISGFHGVGKSVYAKKIAKRYNLKYVSSGLIFRSIAKEKGISIEELSKIAEKDASIDKYIDSKIVKEAKASKHVIVDGLLAGWMLKDIANVKIWVKAKDEIRYSRIARRDGLSIEEAAKRTRLREESEARRFKQFYGINIYDLSIYDFVIDTSYLSIEDVLEILYKIIDCYLSREGR